ncbi:MAG: ABC transporter substrate-binding protein [Anaerolineaceae bacterium]|nr:ABC transporter substrate-binding protein [Anaerolineaceae bacterium]
MKSLKAIVVLILVASFLLAGCTNPASPAAPADNKAATAAPAANSEAPAAAKPTEAPANPPATEAPKALAASGDAVLVVRAYGDPVSFTPNTKADDNGYPIMQNIYNRLVKLDAAKEVIPDLAEKWEISEDGKQITFHLVKTAKWTDGKPVTSKDVKYTFDTIKANPEYIISANLQTVESIETPDDYTVVFKLSEPNVALVAHLGWYACFIVPEHIYNNGKSWDENEAGKNPVTSGPFKLGEFKQGQSVTLVPNPDYFAGAPKLSKVIYTIIPDDATAIQSFLAGEIDDLGSVPPANVAEFKNNPQVKMNLNVFPSPMRIIFNMKNEKVKDLAVRKAIALAVDRDEISQKVFAGIQPPEYSMYPSVVKWVANTENASPKFNIEEARKTLEDAGYKADKDGFYVRGLEIECFQDGNYPDAAKLMAATLAKAGIEMKVNVSEFNAWVAKVAEKKDFIMELQGGFMGPDPSALKARYSTDSSMNWGSYSNPKFDELVLKGGQVGDQAERASLYKEAQKILAEDVPYIPIVGYAAYEAFSANFTNMPIEGAGKWGWQEYTYTEKVK